MSDTPERHSADDERHSRHAVASWEATVNRVIVAALKVTSEAETTIYMGRVECSADSMNELKSALRGLHNDGSECAPQSSEGLV